jgi:hypothetical protein
MLDASVPWEVQHGFTMLLKRLPGENLGEQIRGVRLARNMTDNHTTSTAELAHFNNLRST